MSESRQSGKWVYVGVVIIETGRLALVDPALSDEVVNLGGNEDIVVGAPVSLPEDA